MTGAPARITSRGQRVKRAVLRLPATHLVERYPGHACPGGVSADSVSRVQSKNYFGLGGSLPADSDGADARSEGSPRGVVWTGCGTRGRLQSALGRILAGLLARDILGNHGRESTRHGLEPLVAYCVAAHSQAFSVGIPKRPRTLHYSLQPRANQREARPREGLWLPRGSAALGIYY